MQKVFLPYQSLNLPLNLLWKGSNLTELEKFAMVYLTYKFIN